MGNLRKNNQPLLQKKICAATEERVIVAKGDLTGSGPTPLLIMTKSKAAPDQLSMRVIADDLTAFPERTCRFVNFTPLDIAVIVGRKAATIPRGGIQLVDTDLGKDGSTSYVTVFGMVNGKNGCYPITTGCFVPASVSWCLSLWTKRVSLGSSASWMPWDHSCRYRIRPILPEGFRTLCKHLKTLPDRNHSGLRSDPLPKTSTN